MARKVIWAHSAEEDLDVAASIYTATLLPMLRLSCTEYCKQADL